LVTPPGGIILDPFMGSGSTGVSALEEGFRFEGIDNDPSSFEIAKARISHTEKNIEKKL
jgi:site-specific DNA-methyltransferase (adenine-specific)